jgi:hypothetical protein
MSAVVENGKDAAMGETVGKTSNTVAENECFSAA